MTITAEQIRTVTFSKPPIGKRGYNEDEVDAFLDILEVEVGQKDEELEDLRDQLSSQPVPVSAPQLAPAPVPESVSLQAARILEAAERTADQVAREAEELSERAIREAREKAAETMAEARYEASKLVDSARKEANNIEVRLAELREFEKNYVERLEAYMETQLLALRADRQV